MKTRWKIFQNKKKINIVDDLEIQYYEVQLELYEAKFEIVKIQEILLVTQLDSIKRLIKGKIYILNVYLGYV